MEAKYWIDRWNQKQIGFHQENFHKKLLEYFPYLKPKIGEKVLVPLCGKTKDMLWLREQGLFVHGIELYDEAIESFFSENKLLNVENKKVGSFHRYYADKITIDCGDFFAFEEEKKFDFIYDRAALVALPRSMREAYVGVLLRNLKPQGSCLLITYTYDSSEVEGPPFSIEDSEIRELYEKDFKIQFLESKRPSDEGPRLASLESLKQNVYILERKS